MKGKKKTTLLTLAMALTAVGCAVTGASLCTEWAAADTQTPTLEVVSQNLSYSDSVYILYAVGNEGFDRTENEIKMLFWEQPQEKYTLGTESYASTNEGKITLNETDTLVFYSRGLAAKEMTTDVYSRAVVEINGAAYYSDVMKFSVLEYVNVMRETKDLTVAQENHFNAMLEYGATAQTLFGYKTDRLANDTYNEVTTKNGTLSDGFTQGRFNDNEKITLVAAEMQGEKVFSCWQDKNGVSVGATPVCQVIATEEQCYTATYKDESVVTGTATIDFYSINDMHGKFDDTYANMGVDEMTTYLRNAQTVNESTVLLSAGDMWQGSAESNFTKGKLVTDWMNEMGFAAMTLGNHEFDWGESYLETNETLAKFPFLAINVYDAATNERVDYCESSVLIDQGDVQVGVIGAIGDCYSSIAYEQVQDVYFKVNNELTELVKAESISLRDRGADVIVYVLHDAGASNGEYYDETLSNGYVDLVFEGHSHTQVRQKDSYGVWHLQAGGDNATGLSHATVEIDLATGEVNVTVAEIVSSDVYANYADDPLVDEILAKYAEELTQVNEVLGYNDTYRNSTDLANFMAKAMYVKGEERWGSDPKYAGKIVLGGGYISVRSPYYLPQGNVTYGSIYTLFTFDNPLILCEVTGERLKRQFIESTNYYMYYGSYGSTLRNDVNSIVDTEKYYVVVDTYCANYNFSGMGFMDIVEYYDENQKYFSRDALADYIKTGAMDSLSTAKKATVSELLAIGESIADNATTLESYSLTGTVVKVAHATYGNFTVEDDEGNQIYVYGIYDRNGTVYGSMENKPQVGDTVTLVAPIKRYVNASTSAVTIELYNAILTDYIHETGTEGVIYEILEGGMYAIVTGYEGTATEVKIANTYLGVPVIGVGVEAFSRCENLENIELFDGMIGIEERAFLGTSLETIKIPNSVTFIGSEAFADSDLVKMEIPDSVTSMGHEVFESCYNLTDLIIGDGIIELSKWTCGACPNLKNLVIGRSVKIINACAFELCDGLSNVYYKGSEQEWAEINIGEYNSALTNATRYYYSETKPTGISNYWHYVNDEIVVWEISKEEQGTEGLVYSWCSLTTPEETIYGYSVYSYTGTDTEVVVPSTYSGKPVISVSSNAFEKNPYITSLVLPKSVISTGSDFFTNNDNLTELTCSTMFLAYASDYNNLEILTLLYNSAASLNLSGYDNFKKIVISEEFLTIPDTAFLMCANLQSIVLPYSLTSIGVSAFAGCDSLTNVYYKGTANEWENIAIEAWNNEDLINATRYYYSEMQPTQEGNYWHYDENGEIAVWS